MCGKDVLKGAVENTVEVTAPETVPAEGVSMSVVATAPGTLSALGIVRPGVEAQIHPRQFSDNWMKPKTSKDRKVFEGWLKEQITAEAG